MKWTHKEKNYGRRTPPTLYEKIFIPNVILKLKFSKNKSKIEKMKKTGTYIPVYRPSCSWTGDNRSYGYCAQICTT